MRGFAARKDMMFRSTLIAATCLLASGFAQAQVPGTQLSLGQIRLQDSDLGGGGQVGVDATQLSFSHTWNLAPGRSLGVQLRGDWEDWSFDGPLKSGAAPWGRLQRYGLGMSYLHGLGDGWQLMLSPRAEWAGEDDADAGDSLAWGLIGGAFKSFGANQRVGFGLALSRTVDEETELFPFLIVDWRINDRWRVFNPLGLGLSGPAGVEVSYKLSETVDLGLGGSWRASRFRLSQGNAIASEGVGRFSYVPIFLHLSWKPIAPLTIDAYGGWILNGRLRVDDEGGNTIYKEDLANTPAFGLAANYRF